MEVTGPAASARSRCSTPSGYRRRTARAFSSDELDAGWRLACRVQVSADLRVVVPPLDTRPKAATVGVGRKVILRPALQKRYVELDEASLSDQTSDLERLLSSLDDLELRADLQVLRGLGRVLRASNFKATTVVVDDVLIGVEPGDTSGRLFGVAFDLGTTTVVATLLDLSTGTPLAVRSMLNKQQSFGADVITRISAIMTDKGALARLCQLARESLNELAQLVCESAGVSPGEVYEIALAGNATMTHIVLGIDPGPLGVAPFVLSTRTFPEILARQIGVEVHQRTRAVIFPSVGAYVGGDIVAGLCASGWTVIRAYGCSRTSAPIASWWSATAIASLRRPHRPVLRSKERLSAAVCAPRQARLRS